MRPGRCQIDEWPRGHSVSVLSIRQPGPRHVSTECLQGGSLRLKREYARAYSRVMHVHNPSFALGPARPPARLANRYLCAGRQRGGYPRKPSAG